MNQQKVRRLWREEGAVGAPTPPQTGTTTAPIRAAVKSDDVCAADLQFDATIDGPAVKAVSIVDERTRETLGGLVQHNTTAESLTRELDRTTASRGTRPIVLPSDNGPEFACQAMSDWSGQRSRL